MPGASVPRCRPGRTSVLRLLPVIPCLLILALGLLSRPSMSATIAVPPVTITALPRTYSGAWVHNAVGFTGSGNLSGGFTSDGFTAAISPGDVVVIRFQAPPGKKFVVLTPPNLFQQTFFFNAYWFAGADQSSHADLNTVTLENFRGIAPTETYSNVAIGDGGKFVDAEKTYAVQGQFEFTAFEIDVTASLLMAGTPQTFSAVQSSSSLSWGSSGLWSVPDVQLMEIVDLGAVPARAQSWGRLKSLYR